MALKWLRRRHKRNSAFAPKTSHSTSREAISKGRSIAAATSTTISAATVAAAPAIAGACGMTRATIVAAGAVMLSGVGDVVDGIA